jgi:hypothetical protein
MWAYDLRVVDKPDANTSLMMAEALGTSTHRKTITEDQFKPLVILYESYREYVEYRLDDFDEDTQSWRSYASSIEFPLSVDYAALTYVKSLEGT